MNASAGGRAGPRQRMPNIWEGGHSKDVVGSRLVECSVGGGTRLLEAKPFLRLKAYGVTSAPTSPYPSLTYDNAIGSSSRYIQTTVFAHRGQKTVVWHSLNTVKPPKAPFQSLKRWFACIAALKNQAAAHLYILSGRSMPRRPMAERRTRATASMRTRRYLSTAVSDSLRMGVS